jgi:geranylgeranyl transferase type-2 subunit beta
MYSVAVLSRHGHELDEVKRSATDALRALPSPSGVYDAYLTALCRGLAGAPAPGDGAVRLVRSCRQEDGGYADQPGERSGVNPTAAAIRLLAARGGSPDDAATAAFLASCQTGEGGLAAWPGAPCADLLSTFTGMVALAGMGGLGRIRLAPVARFARALLAEGGGFRAALADDVADTEYTFYGLGVLGLLGSQAARADCSGRDCC